MRQRLFAALVPLSILAACAMDGPAVTDPPASSVAAVVEMQPTLDFSPSPVEIASGGTVEFRNVSAFVHTVSTRPGTSSEAASTELPAGAESFESGPIPAGGIYRHSFTVPGIYRYFCDPHHGLGMVGTIVVR